MGVSVHTIPLGFDNVYAENVQLLIESWQKLLDEGVKTVFPAHGGSFSADIMRQELTRLGA